VVTVALIVRTLYHVALQPSVRGDLFQPQFNYLSRIQVNNIHIEHLESVINYMSLYFPALPDHNKVGFFSSY
jgi:hypothetical protein